MAKTGNPAPAGCASFPQSEAEIPENPFAKFKETNFTSLIAKLDAEKSQQEKHAALKKLQTAKVVKKAAGKPVAKAAAKPTHKVAKSAAKAATSPALASKIQKVKRFADSYFGHDKAHDDMNKKLIANADKPVDAAKLTDDALRDISADKNKFKAFSKFPASSPNSSFRQHHHLTQNPPPPPPPHHRVYQGRERYICALMEASKHQLLKTKTSRMILSWYFLWMCHNSSH